MPVPCPHRRRLPLGSLLVAILSTGTLHAQAVPSAATPALSTDSTARSDSLHAGVAGPGDRVRLHLLNGIVVEGAVERFEGRAVEVRRRNGELSGLIPVELVRRIERRRPSRMNPTLTLAAGTGLGGLGWGGYEALRWGPCESSGWFSCGLFRPTSRGAAFRQGAMIGGLVGFIAATLTVLATPDTWDPVELPTEESPSGRGLSDPAEGRLRGMNVRMEPSTGGVTLEWRIPVGRVVPR